jgi:glycosyl transferase, family 25
MSLADRLFSSFDQIYVVNLAERTDRLAEMAKELERIGTSFDDPRVRRFEAIRPADPGGFRSIGARGCFLSQLEVLRIALRAGHRRILLFEDDLDFVPGIARLLPPLLDALDTHGFGIFYGGYYYSDGEGHGRSGMPLVKADPNRPIRLAHFVGFDRSALERLVPYLELMITRPAGSVAGGPMDVDGAYGWFRAAHPELNTWLAEPQLGVQRPSRTDISAPGLLDRLPVPGWSRTMVRSAKKAWRRHHF